MSISSHSIDQVIVPRSKHFKGPFGRLFRNADIWHPENEATAMADMSAFASTAMAEPAGAPDQNNANLPAGYTYFGQFVDHDVTFDPTSSLQRANDPNKLHNFRTPRLDLDCVYGEGPSDEPFMYDKDRGGMFLIGRVGETNEPDLPRNVKGTAIIGDMRNDENRIVSQFQLSILRLQNAVYGQLIGQDPEDLAASFHMDKSAFEEAHRIVRWFYQYVVWNDYVKRLIKDAIWSSVLSLKDGKMARWVMAVRSINGNISRTSQLNLRSLHIGLDIRWCGRAIRSI